MMIKQLIKDSHKHYTNKKMRRQWVSKTLTMMTTGTHLLAMRVPRKVM